MKTREIIKGMLFVAGIIMFTAACKTKDEGPTLDFNITVPSDWTYYIYSNSGFVYQALSPAKNDTDISEDLVILKIATNNMTLQQFYTSYADALAKDTSYHKISVVDTTVNGEEAIKLTHLQLSKVINEATKDTLILEAKMQKYLMMNNSYGYILSFNALKSTFKEYQPLFDNIIATFTFK